MKRITYKDFATGKPKWTRGRFAFWTEPTGLLNVRYAVIHRERSDILIPVYCLTAESKRAIDYEVRCREIPEQVIAESRLSRPKVKRKHLFGISRKRHGYFLVNTPGRVITREALTEMYKEAREEGLEGPIHVYCACSCIFGEGLDILQVSAEGLPDVK
jgi:hypothetical protein